LDMFSFLPVLARSLDLDYHSDAFERSPPHFLISPQNPPSSSFPSFISLRSLCMI
jgi:hypothetical protein